MKKDTDKLNIKYSVLMSVYYKEDASFFRQSIQSMLDQTYKTDDFVIVCDGPLTPELENVINEFTGDSKYKDIFNIVRLDENVGTGKAANIGISKCKHEYIAKMDSDDIALKDRCSLQMSKLQKDPSIDIIGSYIQEFNSETNDEIAIKKTPANHSDIYEYAKRRNPFNNQTIIYKKSVVQSAGGYSDITRCEDYDLMARLLYNGAKGYNIPKVLVKYRVTDNNYNRRKNWINTKAFFQVRWRILKSGYSKPLDFIIPCTLQMILFIMPGSLTGLLYKKLLRK